MIKFNFGWGVTSDEERLYFCEMDINTFKLHFAKNLEHQDQINAILFALGCAFPPRNILKTEFKMSATTVRIYITGRKDEPVFSEP